MGNLVTEGRKGGRWIFKTGVICGWGEEKVKE